MRVVSWNVQFGLAPATAARELGEHPDLRGADIVLLQGQLLNLITYAMAVNAMSMHVHRQGLAPPVAA